MRVYVKAYLDELLELNDENFNMDFANKILSAIEKGNHEDKEYLINGLSIFDGSNSNSCFSDEYLTRVLEVLTGLERDALEGATSRYQSIHSAFKSTVITFGPLAKFNNEVDTAIDDYLTDVKPGIEVGAFVLLNKAFNDTAKGLISQQGLQNSLEERMMWEVIQARFEPYSDNDGEHAHLINVLINQISSTESEFQAPFPWEVNRI